MEEIEMKKVVPVLVLASALVLSVVGCGGTGPGETPSAPEASADVVRARDAAVTFVRGHFDEVPEASLSWVEERLTPEDLPGGAEWQYTAGDWVVKVSHAVLPPEWTVYRVGVSNKSTGFEWKGRVDGSGRVPEAPESVLVARDEAMRYVSEQYGQDGLGAGLAWQEEWAVGEGIVGAGGYRYSSGDWVVTVSYPVVAPENTIYTISVSSHSTGFQWEGEVDAQGALTEHAAQAPEEMFDRVAARDAALDYVYETYQYPPLDQSVEWQEERLTAEGIVGAETFEYTAESWVVEISYPVVAPEATIYEVTVTNEGLGLEWQGTVDTQGVVTEG
jgi:predicted small lipoprotein YifL